MSEPLPLPITRARRRIIVVGIMTGMFLAALEATVIATAMPTVIAALGGMNHYSWVFSAYLLASTVTVPLWGKLSDLHGRRLYYQIAIAVFLAGSVLSGLATSMTQLIAFRTLQGLGAGGLVPLGMTIVGEIFTLRERARMQGLFSGVWGLASIIGPLMGGFITDQLSWRWVFFINVPFGIAAALIIGFALREPARTERPSIDYAGAATLIASMTMLMLALVESGSVAELLATRNLLLLGGAAVTLALFIVIEQRAAEPVVPLALFRNRVIAVAVAVGFLSGVAMFGVITFVPLFAQGARGESATAAGSLLTPLMLSWVSMSVLGGRLLLRVGYRPMVIAGLSLLTGGFVILSTFGRETSRLALIGDLAMIGCGLGLTMLTLLLAVQHSVPRSQLGIATSLNQFSRSIGGAVGVAVMGAVLSVGFARRLAFAAASGATHLTRLQAERLAQDPSALIDPLARGQVSPATLLLLQEALASSLRSVFVFGGVLSALALLASLWLPADESMPGESPHGFREGERMVMAELTTIDAANEPS